MKGRISQYIVNNQIIKDIIRKNFYFLLIWLTQLLFSPPFDSQFKSFHFLTPKVQYDFTI